MFFQPTEDTECESSKAQDSAFASYVLPEVGVLRRVAMTLTAQPADAEDLVQETLLRAYKAMERFDGRYPRAWLLAILRNVEINRRRRRTPRLVYATNADLERLAAASVVDSPEELIVREGFDEVVGAALAALTDDHWQVMRLVDIGGLSYAETAEALEVPRGTVMSRLHRARERMRVQLKVAGLTRRRPSLM
ncbi:sigma-70 family RNA polymerase sigma factor [Streptomyces sp. NPDC008222]|uniref:sigma-70 family RNA polymerase sigma factor n=1 Tax=Streptomyces sp. NPDC008222 TaxID=3364820 RepID=UPI0036E32102